MKRLMVFLAAAFVLSGLCLAAFHRQLIRSLAVAQLEAVFPASQISVARCSLDPFRKLSFSGVTIKKEDLYEFKIDEAGARFSFPGLITGRLSAVYLSGACIRIDLGRASLSELAKHVNLRGPGAFLIESADLSGIRVDIKSKELRLEGSLSLAVDLPRQELGSCEFRLDSLESFGARVQDAAFSVRQKACGGRLEIRRVKYDKAVVEGVSGTAGLYGSELKFSKVEAALFGGRAAADLEVRLEPVPGYLAKVEFKELDIERFIKDFKLEEKISMTGRLSGSLTLKGRGADIQILEGGFSTGPEGGMILVKDEAMLKEMARASDQPLDILMESFRDYRYNTGIMKLDKTGKDLGLGIALEGEKGKRDLAVTFHDFDLP